MVMMKKTILLLFCLSLVSVVCAQTNHRKMSAWVWQLCQEQASHEGGGRGGHPARISSNGHVPELCAFVRIEGDGEQVLASQGARMLDRQGDIYIASIPLNRLQTLADEPAVSRIEANRSHHLLMDTTAITVNALPVYAGQGLPQAYTGQGVVVGVEDVGFDLEHPNFFSADGAQYRISRFWDMLSADTLESVLYVGADYQGEEAIRALGHSRDGVIMTHGTHTLGTLAGSGADTPYRGMAYESDICIVANAVTEDAEFINPDDYYKYTYATDALGFKYIFDYADECGLPCVVSFSEGSGQDFRGDDILYYSYIDQLLGPGHIMVASAGNTGHFMTYIHKAKDEPRAGARVRASGTTASFTAKSEQPFSMRMTVYDEGAVVAVKEFSLDQVMGAPDQQWNDTLTTDKLPYYLSVRAYPNCYNEAEKVLEGYISTVAKMPDPEHPGDSVKVYLGDVENITIELLGEGAEVDYYNGSGYLHTWYDMTGLQKGVYSIHSPGSAPNVICVGATTQRSSYVNWRGESKTYPQTTIGPGKGARAEYSSIGPTFDGRVKPDVMAPGSFVMSSYSSYYYENNDPDDIVHFTESNGRRYPWGADTGTSMATPIVAGAIALWLQAQPWLTPDDVKGVLQRTSRHIDPSADYPNNKDGYGEIDVYKGLLDVLSLTGIEEIDSYQPREARFDVSHEGLLTISFNSPPAHQVQVALFATSGVKVLSTVVDSGQERAQVDLHSLPKGVYAVQLTTEDASIKGSTLIRR